MGPGAVSRDVSESFSAGLNLRTALGEFTVKSFRLSFMLLSVLFLGQSSAVTAQTPSQSSAVSPKYRTHFVIYDVEEKPPIPAKSLVRGSDTFHKRTDSCAKDCDAAKTARSHHDR